MVPRSTWPEVGSSFAREELHQRRLAGSVDPDEGHAVARPQPPRDSSQHLPGIECERDVDGVQHLVAQTRGGEAQQLGAVARLRLAGDQRVGGVDTELRLGGSGRRSASQPRQLLAHELSAAVLARALLAVALGAGEHVRRVTALVAVDGSVGELPRRGADGVQKPAVVGDDEHRAAARGEVAREPVDTFDVQVVGRLVEQQQLGRVEQQARQRDAPALATGETRDRGVDAGGEEPQLDAAHEPVEDAAKRAVAGPFVLGATADEELADRLALVELVALSQQRDVDVAGPREHPCVHRLDAGDQAQERRLAVAVSPHHADSLPGRYAERDLAQHRAAAVALRDGLQVQEVARGGHTVCILADRRWPAIDRASISKRRRFLALSPVSRPYGVRAQGPSVGSAHAQAPHSALIRARLGLACARVELWIGGDGSFDAERDAIAELRGTVAGGTCAHLCAHA